MKGLFQRLIVGDVQGGNYLEMSPNGLLGHGDFKLSSARARRSRAAGNAVTLATADTAQEITGTSAAGDLVNFLYEDGVLTYIGESQLFLVFFTGIISVNKASDILTAIYIDDTEADGLTMSQTHTAADQLETSSLVGTAQLETGMEIKWYAESSEDATVYAPKSLTMFFLAV